MTFSELTSLATDNGGFVLDYIIPDTNNYKYVGENFVNYDYPKGKYDIFLLIKKK